MKSYSLSHLADAVLLRDLAVLVAQDRITTAALLAHLAEVDARKLYLPAAYPSMYAYCLGELRLSEDSACKRIRAARAARDFPALFPAVADGRLSLGAVILPAPSLTAENVEALVVAAAHKSKSEIEALLASRVARSDAPTLTEPAAAPEVSAGLSAPGRTIFTDSSQSVSPETQLASAEPERHSLHVSVGREMREKLRYALQLLSHQVRPGDVAEVLERALDVLISQLEKRKFAATSRAGRRRSSRGGRRVPAHVKRAVWERDGGQCTFVSEKGRRCEARDQVEYDHVNPVARGGEATVQGMRLRCRAHNQFDAERVFGAGFMEQKRQEARFGAAKRREAAPAEEMKVASLRGKVVVVQDAAMSSANKVSAAKQDPDRDVMPWLRSLGFRADEAKRAAAHCESMSDASLEQRVRAATVFLGRVRFRNVRQSANGMATST